MSFLAGATTYIGVGVLLLMGGAGVPIPEEVVLVLAGAAVHQGKMDLWITLPVAGAVILSADFTVYWLGRVWGQALLGGRFFSRIVRPEGMEKFKQRYAGNFLRGIFTVRFISGLRAPAYFTAGTLRVPAHKFVLADLAALLVHMPAFVLLGYFFSARVSDIIGVLKAADLWIATAVILAALLLAAYVGYRLGRRRGNDESGPSA